MKKITMNDMFKCYLEMGAISNYTYEHAKKDLEIDGIVMMLSSIAGLIALFFIAPLMINANFAYTISLVCFVSITD